MELAQFTTLRVGGPAARMVRPASEVELLASVRDAWASGEETLILGGGSNVVISDNGFDGTVIRVESRGIERREPEVTTASIPSALSSARPSAYNGKRAVRLRVQAGEAWDDVVAYSVSQGWAGIEALSGIPGSAGAAPIQNIGAYGQEIGSSLVSIDFLDYLSGEVVKLRAPELGLGYRTSVLKAGREGLVVAIELELDESTPGHRALSQPIAYAQLATALGVRIGDRVPVDDLRETVLALRASKGMLWDENDPDSISAGSFFTNPIVSENFARGLPPAMPRWPTAPEARERRVPLAAIVDAGPASGVDGSPLAGAGAIAAAPRPPASEYQVKLSAAWLIEAAGIGRGFSLGASRAAISSKHTLAIVNRGGASADDIVQLARFVQTRVFNEFGVRLHPEPVLIGIDL